MPKGVRNGRSVRFEDLTGTEKNGLVFVRFHDIWKQKSRWVIRCHCGTEFVAIGANVLKGNTRSCGCSRAEKLKQPRTKRVAIPCVTCGREVRRTPGQIRNRPRIYCGKQCLPGPRGFVGVGEKNPAWKGGRRIHPNGYVLVRHDGKYVLEHRLVVARHLSRELATGEHVHHKNGDKTDNRIENLLLTTAAEHRGLHPVLTWSKHGHAACVGCGGTDARHVTRGLCTKCYDRERYHLKGRRGQRRNLTRHHGATSRTPTTS